jgi:hypothetical protein
MVVIRLSRGGAKKRRFSNRRCDRACVAMADSSSASASTTRLPPVPNSRCASRSTASSIGPGTAPRCRRRFERLVAQAKAAV